MISAPKVRILRGPPLASRLVELLLWLDESVDKPYDMGMEMFSVLYIHGDFWKSVSPWEYWSHTQNSSHRVNFDFPVGKRASGTATIEIYIETIYWNYYSALAILSAQVWLLLQYNAIYKHCHSILIVLNAFSSWEHFIVQGFFILSLFIWLLSCKLRRLNVVPIKYKIYFESGNRSKLSGL